jgi:hypothetical protein
VLINCLLIVLTIQASADRSFVQSGVINAGTITPGTPKIITVTFSTPFVVNPQFTVLPIRWDYHTNLDETTVHEAFITSLVLLSPTSVTVSLDSGWPINTFTLSWVASVG